jgi:hypothetical protein
MTPPVPQTKMTSFVALGTQQSVVFVRIFTGNSFSQQGVSNDSVG